MTSTMQILAKTAIASVTPPAPPPSTQRLPNLRQHKTEYLQNSTRPKSATVKTHGDNCPFPPPASQQGGKRSRLSVRRLAGMGRIVADDNSEQKKARGRFTSRACDNTKKRCIANGFIYGQAVLRAKRAYSASGAVLDAT